MNTIKKTSAAVLSAALLSLGLAVIPAVGASAHTYGASADCETGLTVGLDYYHATIPGEDAVPGTDAIPGAHHDAVGEPTITIDNPDYVPAVDAVETTYVQEYEYVQKNHPDQIQWHIEGWNPGKGWNATGNSRDSDTVLVQGHDAIPAVGEPTIEIANPDYVAAYDEEGTPAVPGKDAVPEQSNHLTVTEDGDTLIDTSFSTTFHENWPNNDKTVGHDYHVVVTSLDGIGAFTKDIHIDACVVVPPEPIVLVIAPVTHTDATCEAGVTYTVPEQDEHIKYELNGDTRPTPGTYSLGAGESVTIGAHVAAKYLVENGGEYAPVSYSVTIEGADAEDCTVPPTDTPTPPTTPVVPVTPAQPVVPAAATVAPTAISLSAEDTLAQTGSNEDFSGIGAVAGIIIVLGALGLIGAGIYSRRKQAHQK